MPLGFESCLLAGRPLYSVRVMFFVSQHILAFVIDQNPCGCSLRLTEPDRSLISFRPCPVTTLAKLTCCQMETCIHSYTLFPVGFYNSERLQNEGYIYSYSRFRSCQLPFYHFFGWSARTCADLRNRGLAVPQPVFQVTPRRRTTDREGYVYAFEVVLMLTDAAVIVK